ncbi:MAG TPA: hypothetical protein VFR50_12635 [Casimicrobiaceae bacterium]|nr:hypothetical protein [Casimicrobiaceae bacterium]
MKPPRRIAIGLAVLAVAGCAAAPPVPAPVVTPQTEPTSSRPDPLPVTPLPVPEVVIVQAPAAATPQASPAASPPTQVATAQPTLASPVNEEDQQALALLADLQRYVLEPGEDLKRELAAAAAALARTRSDANRVRVAMLLTLPAAGPPDDARALTLLEPLVARNSNGTASPLRQIAAVLYGQITERTRILREEQKRTAAAQEKLDALRAVERSLLLERSRNAGGGSAGGGGGGTGR